MTKASDECAIDLSPWKTEIGNYEAKARLAHQVAQRAENGHVIGCGSGSTSYLTIQALAERIRNEGLSLTAVPTSIETEMVCRSAGMAIAALADGTPHWAFDGADEVDPANNMIKGRGGALLREKQVIDACPQVIIVVDHSKLVERLGTKFAVPVEVEPTLLQEAANKLGRLGAASVVLRTGSGKDGPVITESANVLLDCRFDPIGDGLEAEINRLPGVVDSGLFQGRSIELITD